MAEMGRRLKVIDRERVEVEGFEVRDPGPGQVLVRVSRTQVSAGSEMGFLQPLPPDHPSARMDRSTDPDPTANADTMPMIPTSPQDRPGYTAVGRVQALGPGVAEFEAGDRVFALGRHGTHLIVNVEQVENETLRRPVQKIEFDITDEQACFSRLGDVALHSIRRAALQPDESVAIFGQGVVGQLIASMSRIAGAYPIIGVDLEAERLALSKTSGASHTVNGSEVDSVGAVMEISEGGAQTVFHANRVAQMLADCIDSARYAGKVVLVGATRGKLEMRLRNLLVREIDVRGSHWQEDEPHKYYHWTTNRDRQAVMRMIATGDLKVDHLISHVAKPDEADRLYHEMLGGPKGWMGIFFDWDD
jgi:2-desacetyl-2-hydroxyethyl bacteriochlorophyllide A dehydrogenase